MVKTQSLQPQPESQLLRENRVFMAIILVTLILVAVISYKLGSRTEESSTLVQLTPPPTNSPAPSTSPTITTITSEPTRTVTQPPIPSDWKKYSAEDPDFRARVTISLPPGFSFSFSGSEFTLQNDSDATELWDVQTSQFRGDDGVKNYYDGSSRRAWYERYLSGEFSSGNKRGTVLSVIDKGSYLQVQVKTTFDTTETHYIGVKNGYMAMFSPVSHKANSDEAKIPTYIGNIFASLSITTF